MAGVTPEGFEIKPLATIRQEVEDSQRQAIDPGLDLSDQSVLGQINGTHIGELAELWELGQAVYNSQYPDTASGDSLTSVASLTGTTREGAEKTIVRNVRVTLNPNSPLPLGSVANIFNQPAARFLSLAAVPAVPAGQSVLVDFEAESTGAITVEDGALSQIAEPQPGWTTVNNDQSAPDNSITEVGSAVETDDALRVSRETELESQGSTFVDAIRADVSKLDGVVGTSVFENDTDDIVGGLIPHSVHVIVRGGTPQEIFDQIFASKAAGINTNGAQVGTATDSQGFDHTIRYDEATVLDFFATLDIVVDALVFDPINGEDLIKSAIAAYVNSLGTGKDVIYDQVKCAALDVAGVVKFNSVLIGFGVADQTIDLPVAQDQFPLSDVSNIVTVV